MTKRYASMARMYGKDESSSRYFGHSLQLTNWILDSGAMCNMKPQVSDFIPGSLEDKNKKLKLRMDTTLRRSKNGKVQIKTCDNKGDTLSRHFTTYFWHHIYETGYF